MKLDLSPSSGRLSGTFTDSNGLTAQFNAPALGTSAETVLEFPEQSVKIRVYPEAVGLSMLAIPLAADGAPRNAESTLLAFVPEGMEVPETPQGYVAPVNRVRVIDPDSFLISYEFWPPDAVAYGYEGMEARFRPMIGLFPVVLTDILWKMCAADYRPAVLGEALRGQGVTCDDVLRRMDALQRSGGFASWKARVGREKAQVIEASRCARGFIARPEVCEPAAQRVAEAAVSMTTVRSVLDGL